MNALLAVTSALLLAAPLPFPPPRQTPVTEAIRCDWGTVVSVNEPVGTLVVRTPAGPVTYLAAPDTQVFAADGRPAGAVTVLRAGQMVRLYYVLDQGAKVSEIDLQ